MTVEQMFEKLGLPEHAGMAFAITQKAIVDGAIDDVSTIPCPTYEHRVMKDLRTDNILVIRPAPDGKYQFAESPNFKRLR